MTREDINDIINAICPNDEDYEKPCISPKYLRQELEQLALDQRQWNGEPTTKNDLGVDCISREQAIEEADKLCLETGYDNEKVIKMLNELPSVTPIRPKGHWTEEFNDLEGEVRFTCSSCGKYQLFGTDFCYNCGSDNREVEE